jgi:hypothetical protein
MWNGFSSLSQRSLAPKSAGGQRRLTKSSFDKPVDRMAPVADFTHHSRAIGLKRFSSVNMLRMMSGQPLRIFPEYTCID